ncbi:MAG: succinate-semialdehyde dehydrogenase / glutarate-semialdehyde dehydrogenase [Actinomycetota bacterium]|jgi:succinate-semialdehyde dehydrogenase/glutarate-semialdehyde dehydrogenase|nr:succinate-semialdehyde dehydrogenase / glutarate-semialdehyde dehydrogenase [Actinomycetota bacterium]
MAIATVNPATGETLKTFDALSDDELRERIRRAADAFASYRLTTFEERAGWMNAAAELLDADTDELAQLMTTEMGKTLKAAKAEVGKCATGCRYYAAHAAEFLADQPADAAAIKAVEAYARYQPLGPVLAVMPWNFPLWQAMRFAAPALMAGNVGLLKHASNVPQTALYMEELFRRAGFPADVFQTLLIATKQVEIVLSDDRVAAATLTGSTPAGRSVASISGKHLKKTVLELGGSDPFVVMPSAELAKAAEVAVTARVQNNGQSCIAAKRFLVHADVAEEWTSLFVERMKALVVGDPTDDATDIGPLATESGLHDLEELVDDAVAKGATVLCGGKPADGRGWFYPPTVLADVDESMQIWTEEAFGPVAVVRTFAHIDEAVRLANDSQFGLGSNFWTDDADEQARFIRDAEAGMVTINGMTTSYPELPFGGVKNSGYGRELSAQGIREFCNVKAVWRG